MTERNFWVPTVRNQSYLLGHESQKKNHEAKLVKKLKSHFKYKVNKAKPSASKTFENSSFDRRAFC